MDRNECWGGIGGCGAGSWTSGHDADGSTGRTGRGAGTEVIPYVDPVEGFQGWLDFSGRNHRLAAGGFRVPKGLGGATLARSVPVRGIARFDRVQREGHLRLAST